MHLARLHTILSPIITMQEKEATLLTDKHILLCIKEDLMEIDVKLAKQLQYIKQNFCGMVFSDLTTFNEHKRHPDALIYFCGDAQKHNDIINNQPLVLVVTELSTNYDTKQQQQQLINMGKVPINIYNTGVYFNNFFGDHKSYFHLINSEHKFQSLTESNKSSNAFRTGIYLTPVTQDTTNPEVIKFKLLRCSSNLNGPTDNFRTTDHEVVSQVNDISKHFFADSAQLNHVLAQIYENKTQNTDGIQKDKKAKIKAHSDKTKDMPRSGLIAFCTFYQETSNNQQSDESCLTKLRFILKDSATDPRLEKKFDVMLYPNSVFIIPLSTNRLYTHEIVPSSKSVDKIPTRMGYVIRCSKTNAVFEKDKTYIIYKDSCVQMQEPDINSINELKTLYYKENTTTELIDYNNKFNFSLNKGDYIQPII